MHEIINWFNTNQGFAGAVISVLAMVISIVFGIISICKSKKAKAYAENADKYNIIAKEYYEKIIKFMNNEININLIYERGINGHRISEAIQIINNSSNTITLVELGVYLDNHKIDIKKLNIEIEELPLSVLPDSEVKITSATFRDDYIHKEDLYTFLGFCLFGAENIFIKNESDPDVYFFVKDTSGKEYKNFIGKRNDINERYKKL